MTQYKVTMLKDKLLLQKHEEQPDSEFIATDDVNRTGAIYEVKYAGDQSDWSPGDLVALFTGSYSNIQINGETYVVASDEDVMAEAEEVQK